MLTPPTPARRLRKMKCALKGTLAVGVLALMLASCGGGGGTGGSSGGGGKHGSSSSAGTTTTTEGASGGTIKTVVIKESEFKLSPSSVTLSKPGTYAFKAQNKGATQHSLEIEGKGVKSEGGEAGEAKLEHTLNPGQSSVLTVSFQKPGTYVMYCPVFGHKLAGMKGEVVVK
jgi:uncharacterized cupredoxin-like copper-binding protein